MVASAIPMQANKGYAPAVCGAKCRDGHKCCNKPVDGAKRCRMHGGTSPKGIASPHFKHGKYSQYMPERLRERYAEAVADPQLLELDHEIALVDTRLKDLLTRVDTGEAAKNWKQAREINDEIKEALMNENYGAVVIACTALDRLIGPSLNDFEAWDQISTLLEQRRKLVESQRKRLIEAQQVITAEQAMTFVAAVLDSVKRNVTDKAALQMISFDIAKLTAVNATVRSGD